MRVYTRKQRKISYLWIDFSFQGKRYRKPLNLEDTPKNRKLAKTVMIPEIQVKLNNGKFFNTNNEMPTFNEYKVESFAMNNGTRRESTRYDYELNYNNHIAPYFGERKLDGLKVSELRKWQSNLLEKLKARTVRNIRSVLSSILMDALRDEIITSNPLKLVKVPPLEEVDIMPFAEDEMFHILNSADGQYKNFFALAFFTGMRSGEMIGLRWEDINFKREEINISQGIRMGKIGLTKTVSSKRIIDMIDVLIPYLQEQKKLTGDSEYVFVNEDGEHIYDIKRIRDTHWKKILKKCGFKYRPIYHTRHTFAAVMLENGEDVLWVAHMLGHKDANITLSTYARYIKRKNKTRGAFLQETVAQNGTNLALCKLKFA